MVQAALPFTLTVRVWSADRDNRAIRGCDRPNWGIVRENRFHLRCLGGRSICDSTLWRIGRPVDSYCSFQTSHDETLIAPIAMGVMEEGQYDTLHLVLVLPNGQALIPVKNNEIKPSRLHMTERVATWGLSR